MTVIYQHKQELLWKLHGGLCYLCGRSVEFESMTVDHVQPIADGGSKYSLANVAPAHYQCNHNKGSKSVEEYIPKHAAAARRRVAEADYLRRYLNWFRMVYAMPNWTAILR